MQDREFAKILTSWAAVSLRQAIYDFNRYTRRSGLSFIQMSVLLHLLEHGPCEIMEFSSELQLSSSGASQLVDRMVQQGLVTREENPTDRRARMVSLTAHGCEVAQESIATHSVWMETLTEALSEQQKEVVGSTLKLLIEKGKKD